MCWISSMLSKIWVEMVASTKKRISLLLVVGMLNWQSKGLKFKILLKESIESIESWRKRTVVKVASFLKRTTPSSCIGRFLHCVKIVSLTSSFMEGSMHENITFAFWISWLFVWTVWKVTIWELVMEWYSIQKKMLPTMRIPMSPAVSYFPFLTLMRRETTKDGNVDTLPFHILSRWDDTMMYVDDLNRENKSKGLLVIGIVNLWGDWCCWNCYNCLS